MTPEQAYDWLAPKLSSGERQALDVIDKAASNRGSALEKLRQWAEAYPVEVFPEMSKEDWARADKVLAASGLSLTRISASNMRHVIEQTKQIVAEGMVA